ncbi:uncharacterized protein CANTADRAFT_27419 [Suhomyces tanzawaensis NRRL Y-17324]|uniref:Uncharacterized protein n=1 Tax=Suhomyces tanzawaensis NRRL Y-17324 TaxID=984487 RepID=A0A1E4SC88_9ASCO|nr:uncharacterized protein CANTADRAFT_27419 [Suhomyces tanzawaensis NRRL Y-17324]ODV77002.1 hypothetical protein CANTADRAFT_27419 [Suhomyces tanzawaensis NRRL Y-17324]
MIVLPNTPPLPLATKIRTSLSELTTKRSSVVTDSIGNYNDSIRYAVNLELYLEDIFRFGVERTQREDQGELIRSFTTIEMATKDIPWKGVGRSTRFRAKLMKKFARDESKELSWTLANEVETVLVSLSFIYIKIGSELTNELIDSSKDNDDTTKKWKQVAAFYRKAISFSAFGKYVSEIAISCDLGSISPLVFLFIIKISEICIQMSILSKSSWINRLSFDMSNSISTKNNGMLSRVAIFIVNELAASKVLLKELDTTVSEIDTSNWQEYLEVVEKYSNAYAGLFLAIENYQQDKLGHAIGLLNFSLLNLQSKKVEVNDTKKLSKLKSKYLIMKNESVLKSLNSVSTLNFDKSVFNDKSGIILNDLTYLFDQLIALHLKFTKENDNLKFDKVVDWSEVHNDSKWPLGTLIPTSKVTAYNPLGNSSTSSENQTEGGYY